MCLIFIKADFNYFLLILNDRTEHNIEYNMHSQVRLSN